MLDTLGSAMDKTRGKGGKPSPWWWLVAGLVLLVGLLVAAWISNRNNRELARLRHAAEKARIEQGDAQAANAASRHSENAKAAEARAAEAQKQVEELNESIKEAEAQHEVDNDAIDRLRWSDLPRAEDS